MIVAIHKKLTEAEFLTEDYPKSKISPSTRRHKIKSNSEYMPPFRPLFRVANIGSETFSSSMTPAQREDVSNPRFGMTVTKIPVLGDPEGVLTLPDLPEDYLDVTLVEDDGYPLEEILESYPLAIGGVTTERVLDAKKLSNGENVKEIYSVDLSTSFSSFKPGDTVGIITQNRAEDVTNLFNHLGITHLSEEKCIITEKNPSLKKKQMRLAFLGKVTTLQHLFTHCLDIQCIPKKSLIRLLAQFTKDDQEKRQLEELCSKEKSDLYMKTVLEVNKTFLDFLLSFPSCCPPVVRIIENLPNLQPRPYSIASSPLASTNRIKLVFSVTKTENGREGLCTGMLKKMISESEEGKVNIYFRKCNGFNLPETDVPLILVGPGTGIAPFMGFLEHRKMEGKGGVIWLFYGCRSRTGDYLFKEELEEYLELGVLTKLSVAFSREPDAEAKYVQDNIRKHGKEITDLIFDQNAMIYVCGDAKNMRKDVQNGFVEVLEKHKGMTNKEAMEFVKKLQKDKRYLQDIWA